MLLSRILAIYGISQLFACLSGENSLALLEAGSDEKNKQTFSVTRQDFLISMQLNSKHVNSEVCATDFCGTDSKESVQKNCSFHFIYSKRDCDRC